LGRRYDVHRIRFSTTVELVAPWAFDLEFADGDLDVNQHRTVEDLASHSARPSQALGSRRGINRAVTSSCHDEASASLPSIWGRPRRGQFALKVQRVGDFQSERSTFRGLALGVCGNVHVKVYGRSSHHRR
jgi:imidazoleglycerol phosphate dehydratase HisB